MGGLNQYTYVDGNPVGWVDPLGLFTTTGNGFENINVYTKEPKLQLSEKVRKLYQQGKYREAMDFHYEDLIIRKTQGKAQIIDGYEYNAVTDDAIIQAKRTISAINKPHNFLNKKTKNQIKRTIELANSVGKEPQFWFKYGISLKVKDYIKGKGGKVITGLGD